MIFVCRACLKRSYERCGVICLHIAAVAYEGHFEHCCARLDQDGFIGVVIFSLSLPATRVAVADFDPVFLTVARAGFAGLLALSLLFLYREKRPEPAQVLSLLVVALGVVVGFPLLTALALQTHHVSAFHRVHRAAATGDGDFRCRAWWRTTYPRVLVFLEPRQRLRRGICMV